MKIAVFGGTNMDILGTPQAALRLRDSNIGSVSLRPGGVGRNIAAQIADSGAACTLFTAFGGDLPGAMLQSDCQRRGIDISCAHHAQEASCIYLCVHDETGDMLAAINDMALTKTLSPDYASAHMDCVNAHDVCVLDANLPAETLLYVAKNARIPLLLDPVSCAKAERARDILPYLTAIKPNLYEARLLTGKDSPLDCAKMLVSMGAARAFVSLGEEGLCYADREESGLLPVLEKSNAVKTGAGDALCAGISIGLALGENTRACAQKGMAYAAAFLKNKLAKGE